MDQFKAVQTSLSETITIVNVGELKNILRRLRFPKSLCDGDLCDQIMFRRDDGEIAGAIVGDIFSALTSPDDPNTLPWIQLMTVEDLMRNYIPTSVKDVASAQKIFDELKDVVDDAFGASNTAEPSPTQDEEHANECESFCSELDLSIPKQKLLMVSFTRHDEKFHCYINVNYDKKLSKIKNKKFIKKALKNLNKKYGNDDIEFVDIFGWVNVDGNNRTDMYIWSNDSSANHFTSDAE